MKIFIGYETRQDVAYQVLKYTILKNTPRKVTILPLVLKSIQRELNWTRPFDPLASTEFTYTRFLVPYLCGFEGPAIYLDCDFICLANIAELFDLFDDKFAVQVVKHKHQPIESSKMGGRVQTLYPRKNWSSLMLLNCARLSMWTPENVALKSAAWLHRFEPIPDSEIGGLPDIWNTLDVMRENTKLLHLTSGGPWLYGCQAHPASDLWHQYYYEMLQSNQGVRLCPTL